MINSPYPLFRLIYITYSLSCVWFMCVVYEGSNAKIYPKKTAQMVCDPRNT